MHKCVRACEHVRMPYMHIAARERQGVGCPALPLFVSSIPLRQGLFLSYPGVRLGVSKLQKYHNTG